MNNTIGNLHLIKTENLQVNSLGSNIKNILNITTNITIANNADSPFFVTINFSPPMIGTYRVHSNALSNNNDLMIATSACSFGSTSFRLGLYSLTPNNAFKFGSQTG